MIPNQVSSRTRQNQFWTPTPTPDTPERGTPSGTNRETSKPKKRVHFEYTPDPDIIQTENEATA